MKKCKQCGDIFNSVPFAHKTCSKKCEEVFEKEKRKADMLKKKERDLKKKEKTREKRNKKLFYAPKKLTEIADTIFQWYIRERDKGKPCVTIGGKFCQRYENIQAGHFIPRGEYSTRWNPMNCHGQCGGCNSKYMGNGEMYLHGSRINEMYGSGTAEMLIALRGPHKVTDEHKIQVINEFAMLLVNQHGKTFDDINEYCQKAIGQKSFDIAKYIK